MFDTGIIHLFSCAVSLVFALSVGAGERFPGAGGETPNAPVNPTSWMADSYHNRPDTRLRDICLVGTHDSGTYSIKTPDRIAARTTNASIREQLERGARHLDIRVKLHRGQWKAYHGPSIGAPATDIFYDLQQFSLAHPKEIIFLFFRFHDDVTDEQQDSFMETIFTPMIGDRVQNHLSWWQIKSVTFANMWNRGKSFIVFDYGQAERWFPRWRSLVSTPPYLGTPDPEVHIINELDHIAEPRNGNFHLAGVSLTPSVSSKGEFWKSLKSGFSVELLARKINTPALIYAMDREAKRSGQRANMINGNFMDEQRAFEACMDINDTHELFFELRNKGLGLCLEAFADDRGQPDVRIWSCDGSAGQQWDYRHGDSQLVNRGFDNHCLSLDGVPEQGASLTLKACTNGPAFGFEFHEDTLRSKGAVHLVLGTQLEQGDRIILQQLQGQKSQTWERVFVPGATGSNR